MIDRDDNGQIAARQRRDANREVRIKLAEHIADQQARIAELESDLDDWRFTNKVDELERELARRGERIAELEAATDKLAAGQNPVQDRVAFNELIAVREKNLHK